MMGRARGRRPGGRRRFALAAAIGAAFAVASGTVALAENTVCVGESCDGSAAAISTTGQANSSGGVAVSAAGHANGSVASISPFGNASRESNVTTNQESMLTSIGVIDNTTWAYGQTGIDNYIGTYAEAAATAREQLGIPTQVDLLTDEVDDTLRTTIDQLLLNNAEVLTQGTVQTVNAPVDQAVDFVDTTTLYAIGGMLSCPPTYTCARSASSSYDEYRTMNEQEQRVCRWNPHDCNRIKHTAGDAYAQTQKRYGRNGNNDKSDAFRHCMWTALMTKRANVSFAYDMGNAHENGTPHNPQREKDMDFHNNYYGRNVGYNGEHDHDTVLGNRCITLQGYGYLYWLQ